ncbi:hypothetical protein LEMLEM_LOCUS4830, partial [Lemmus lemmus]
FPQRGRRSRTSFLRKTEGRPSPVLKTTLQRENLALLSCDIRPETSRVLRTDPDSQLEQVTWRRKESAHSSFPH